MADCYSLCSLFVFLHIVRGTPQIKGLYCQDPDNLKLYPINSTWPSETFCGNYTCKLRKKNITQTEYAPLKKINITAVNKRNETLTSDMATSPSEHAFVVINHETTKQPVYNKEAINKLSALADHDNNSKSDEHDRYLTESEIKTITEILHTVKKSDLDAIVEIYNIAHDIYKEMDTITTEKMVKDNVDTIQSGKHDLNKIGKDAVSYWYEPLQHSSTKVKPKDSKPDGTDSLPTTKSFTYPPTYFKGVLTEKDFRKLPYYYPTSNFQRMSSYLNNKMPYNMQENIPHKPCNYKQSNTHLPPWFNTPIKARKVVPEHRKNQGIQPMLLPYPFSYINHYNFSTYPNSIFYSNYPWAELDVYNRYKNYPHQYYSEYFTPVSTTAVAADIQQIAESGQQYEDHVSNNDDDTQIITSSEVGRLHEWQTEQLSDNVLKEVKANILENSKLLKPIPLRKNIKLEKVGKVIKLDELTRTKRYIIDTDVKYNDKVNTQYESYIERTTCESSTELGFFRMGNLTEPYPACCPQKIRSL